MPLPDLVENLRNLIMSHRGRDEAGFRQSAEAIIRELNVGNRSGEAKYLRTALGTANGAQNPISLQFTQLNKQANGLVTFVDSAPGTNLVFKRETHSALEQLIEERRASHRLAEAGLTARSKVLFWGPPGCGKTAAASWLATELEVPLGIVRVGALITSFVGETGANLQRILALAAQTPMVLLLDEADAVAKTRSDSQDVGEVRRVVNALLQGLDGFVGSQSVIVFASNHSHVFDSAMWRRFDDVIQFPLPGKKERLDLLKQLTNGLHLKGSLKSVADDLEDCSFADVERAVQEVAKKCVLSDSAGANASEIVKYATQWRRKLAGANSARRGRKMGR